MIYELTTTREGEGYEHVLSMKNGSSFENVVIWNRKQKRRGSIAAMINSYARQNESQLANVGRLEKATSRLEVGK